MQRCPYIHEMRERLLGQLNNESMPLRTVEREELIDNQQNIMMDHNQVGTVVKVGAMLVCNFVAPNYNLFLKHESSALSLPNSIKKHAQNYTASKFVV